MSKINNLVVFKFGINLNTMFDVILGITKIKLEKKVLFLNQRLNMKTNNKIDVLDLASTNIENIDLDNYSVVLIDSNMNDLIKNIATNPKHEDIVFIVCSFDSSNVEENLYAFIDFEELISLPLFKKISKVNEIRNKLKTNKALKKFKFF